MIVQTTFSLKAMLSAPRRSPAVPNQDGGRALLTVSTYTEGEGVSKELRVMEIPSGSSFQLIRNDNIHDANWIGDNSNTILYLRDGLRGVTRLMTLDADHPFEEARHVADIPGPVNHMKLAGLDDGSVAVAVCGLVGSDRRLYNHKVEPRTSGPRIFDSLHSLQSNTPAGSPRQTLWFSRLTKEGERWKLSGPFQNALRDTNLEVVSSFTRNQDKRLITSYDICNHGIVFVARNTEERDPTRTEASDVYYIPLDSFDTVTRYKPRKLVNMPLDFDGYCSNPRFSPDRSVVGYIKAPFNSPVDARIYLSHIGSYTAHDVFSKVTHNSWDLSPVGFEFSPKAGWIFMTAEDCGRMALYDLELQQHATPRPLLRNGTVSGYYALPHSNGDKLLVSSSSFVDSSLIQIIDIPEEIPTQIVSSATRHGAKLRLSHKQISEFYFEGGGDYCVQAWMVKPPGFDSSKKYPLALLLHDGPNGAWRDEWSTLWNLALWAEQGYVVVAPNITGSLGFGVPFATAVYNDWVVRPCDDIVNCMEFLKDFPFLDMSKATAAGSGYGGYLVNWIAGQPLAEKFQAFVTDNGMLGLASTILGHEIPGTVTRAQDNSPPTFTKWNPELLERTRLWKTPTLVIHNLLNSRCPLSEGLAVFSTLQMLQVPSRFLQLPDQDTQEMSPSIAVERYQVMFEWISSHITGGQGTTEQHIQWQ